MAGNHDLNFTIRANVDEIDRVLKRISHVTGNSLSMAMEGALKKSEATIKQFQDARFVHDPIKDVYKDAFGGILSSADYTKRAGDIKELQTKRDILLAKKSEMDFKRAINEVRSSFLETAGTVALIGKLFMQPIKDAMQYEKSLTNVAKVYNLNKMQTDQFGRSLMNLSKVMPVPIENLGDLAYQMSQLGIAQKDLIPAVQLAVKAGLGLDIPLPEVGTKIGRLKSAFGLSIQGLSEVLDFVNEASNRVAATPSEILNAVTRIAPLSSTLGITAQQTTGLASVLLGIGLQPEAVETGIKDLLSNLSSIFTSRVGDSERYGAIQKLKLDRTKFEDALRTDKFKALAMFFEAGEKAKLRGENLDTILLKIFGQNHYTKILALFNKEGLAKRREFLNMASDPGTYLGSLQKEYERVSQTASSLLQIMKNNLKAFSVTIGDYLLPKVKTLFTYLRAAFDIAQSFFAQHPTIAKIGLTLALWGGSIVVFNGALKIATGLLGVMKALLLFGGGKYGLLTPTIMGIMFLPVLLNQIADMFGISTKTLGTIAGTIAGGAYGYMKKGVLGGAIGAVSGGIGGFTAGAISQKTPELMKNIEESIQKKMNFDEAFDKMSKNNNVFLDEQKKLITSQPEQTTINKTYNDNRIITINTNNASEELLDRFKEQGIKPAWRIGDIDE